MSAACACKGSRTVAFTTLGWRCESCGGDADLSAVFPPDTPLMASWRTRADDAGKRAMAHVQAQRLAAMMAPPTLPASTREGDVLVAPDGTCRSLSAPLAAMYPTTDEDGTAKDPRVVAEDRCRAFWESCTDFEKATLRWLSGREGWTDQRALDVRTREWRRGK